MSDDDIVEMAPAAKLVRSNGGGGARACGGDEAAVLTVNCFTPLVLPGTEYIHFRFKHFDPSLHGMAAVAPGDWGGRYDQCVHTGLDVFRRPLDIDSAALLDDASLRRLGFAKDKLHFAAATSGASLLYVRQNATFLLDQRLDLCMHLLDADTASADGAALAQLQAHMRMLLVYDPRKEAEADPATVTDEQRVHFKICAWSDACQKASLRAVQHTLRGHLDAKVELPPSFGYIWQVFPHCRRVVPQPLLDGVLANFHSGDRLDDEREVADKIRLPGVAEEGGGAEAPPPLVFFGWTSTTLWGVAESTTTALFPVVLFVDVSYFVYQSYFAKMTASLFDAIFYFNSGRDRLRPLQILADKLMLLVDRGVHEKDLVVSKLRPQAAAVFNAYWAYWSMPGMIAGASGSLEKSLRSIENNIALAADRASRKQNNLLFVVAIVQIVTMLGFLSDYDSVAELHGDWANIILGGLILLSIVLVLNSFYEQISRWLRQTFGGKQESDGGGMEMGDIV